LAVEDRCDGNFLTTDGFGEFGKGDLLGFFGGEEGVADGGEAGGEGGLVVVELSMAGEDGMLERRRGEVDVRLGLRRACRRSRPLVRLFATLCCIVTCCLIRADEDEEAGLSKLPI